MTHTEFDPFAASAAYFPTQLQQTVYTEKYARWDWDLGRRETWVETVGRAHGFLRELSGNRLAPADYAFIEQSTLELRAMPSMRLLAMAGEAARRQNIAIYNCSALPLSDLWAFSEVMLLSMNGTGVGYSVEKQFVSQLPPVARQTGRHRGTHYIDDSTEGWVSALTSLLGALFAGDDIDFDYDFIRPAGSILRVKGGRASGPEPLRAAFASIRSIILGAQGRQLRPFEAHRIACLVAAASISGGVRRSALIALFDAGDPEMRRCKAGFGWWDTYPELMYANNSAVIGNTAGDVEGLLREMDANGTGEPGLFNREGVEANLPARRKKGHPWLVNPCVTGDTLVLRDDGTLHRADALVEAGGSTAFAPWRYSLDNASLAGTYFWSNGVKPVYRLTTEEGYELKLTADHRVMTDAGWIEAQNLRPGDAVRLVVPRYHFEDNPAQFAAGWQAGYFVGNGTYSSGRPLLYFYEGVWEDAEAMLNGNAIRYQQGSARWVAAGAVLDKYVWRFVGHEDKHRLSPSLYGDGFSVRAGFLAGLFDADGSVQGSKEKGFSVRLSQSNEAYLKDIQRLLLTFGVPSTLRKCHDACIKQMPDGHGGYAEFACKANFELIISGRALRRYAEVIGFTHPAKAEKLASALSGRVRGFYREGQDYFATFAALEYIGEEEVYDCSVPGPNAFSANGLYVHNCGEIVLRPYQTCNLSSVVCREEDSLETLLMKVEAATIIGTIQSMADSFPGFRPEWERNQREERLLGVDLNGQMDSPLAQQPEVQRILREHAIKTNEKYARLLGINQAAAVTTVKPSGNSSQLLNASSGLHARWSPYYIRHIRFNAHSPVRRMLADQGMPMLPENGQTEDNATTWVVPFPVKSPEGAVFRNARTALEQLDYWLSVRQNWTEHQPSVTIHYRRDEVEGIVAWVIEHREYVAGLSFLPADDHAYPLAPYVEVSREEYEQLAAMVPTIDFSQLVHYEADDYTEVAQELACSSGVCEIL